MSHARRVPYVRVLSLAALLTAPLLTAPLLPSAPAHAAAPMPTGRQLSAHPMTDAAVFSASDAARAARPASVPLRATARGLAAVRWASHRRYWPTRTCMIFVRTSLGVAGRYPTPRVAWAAARYRHRTRFAAIPPGVPVYSAGRTAPGHIVLSLGRGMVRSTDWPRPGRVGTVSLRRLLRTWHHHYLGWSEDLNGVRVWSRRR